MSEQKFPDPINKEFLISNQREMAIIANQIQIEVLSTIEYPDHPYNNYHWKTSDETLRDGWGYCADIAILMYIRLLEEGVDPSRLKLALVGQNRVEHCLIFVGDRPYLIANPDFNVFNTFTKDYFN